MTQKGQQQKTQNKLIPMCGRAYVFPVGPLIVRTKWTPSCSDDVDILTQKSQKTPFSIIKSSVTI